MSNCRYLIVTPVKNEEKNLPNLIQSVAEQTIKPVLWIIVDDGSTDKSPEIIEKTKEKYEWIETVHFGHETKRALGIHYSRVVKKGFDFGFEHCNKNGIEYDYIGILDGDMILERDYFEKLIGKFNNNLKIGIASGDLYYYDANNELRCEKTDKSCPRGSGRLWRKECFKECDGYIIGKSADSISLAKARINGWEIKVFSDVKAIQTRKTSSVGGLWAGTKYWGETSYYLGHCPLFVLLKGLKLLLSEKPHYIGLSYWWGYLFSIIKRDKQIDDKEVRYYFRHVRPRELKKRYIQKILRMMRYEKNKH